MNNSLLAKKIETGDFIITAEYLPGTQTGTIPAEELKRSGAIAINVADNPDGPIISSLAGAIKLKQADIEPVYQIVTRDRNRIALQSDILGAASLGVNNILCLSGYHQSLSNLPQSANVYDIDSIQLIDMINRMKTEKVLLNGNKIDGDFSILIGAVANPYFRPLELNILRLIKKVNAGANFIQTQAVFNTTDFQEWLDAAYLEGLTEKAAFIAGIYPLASYDEAIMLLGKYTDFYIPNSHIQRIKDAGDAEEQKKAGIAICVETIKKIKGMKGLSGIHIISGGKEDLINEIVSEAGL
ncbi:MAG TPA: methylenetetrahydrofolate reductase [Bacteroidales bacterium]|jgi:methylenetetrahydrofolate reductase (NADPH)|nr:methylenetetrahydrofolate reductase [Bacteroidales bacterium]